MEFADREETISHAFPLQALEMEINAAVSTETLGKLADPKLGNSNVEINLTGYKRNLNKFAD